MEIGRVAIERATKRLVFKFSHKRSKCLDVEIASGNFCFIVVHA